MPPTTLLRSASACALILASLATANAQVSLPQIVVGAQRAAPATAPLEQAGDAAVVSQQEIVEQKPDVSDTAKLLERQPGVSVQTEIGRAHV